MANVLKVILDGDSKKLTGALDRASSKLTSFGKKTKQIGSSLSRSITLPMAAAGGVAIKMAADFDKSMTQIVSLVGLSSESVKAMEGDVKSLATSTGKNANEAAEALFYITSAGLKGEQAMKVLEASLKASAIGLGETRVVADLATSAMNAFGAETLSATDATDVMVSTVRLGKLEASELAGAMGQVLPIASNMGVSFNEVGAAFAGMSRTGTNASMAAVQLRQILASLLKPTKDAEDTLSSLGLSSASLRQNIRENGLLNTLEILKEKFEGNDQAAALVFGNIRALSGVMDLLGKGVDTTRQIFAEMNEVTGATANGFDILSQSASFRLTQSLTELKNMFVDVGGVLLTAIIPHIRSFVDIVGNIVNAFMNLTPQTQSLVLALGGIAAAIGPIMTIGGALISVLGAIISPAGLVVAALAAVAYVVIDNWSVVRKYLVDFINYFIDLYNESLGFRILIQSIIAYFKTWWDAVKIFVSGFVRQFKTGIKTIIDQFSNLGTIIKGVFTLDADLIAQGVSDAMSTYKEFGKETADNFGDMFEKIGDSAGTHFTDALEKAMKPQKVAQVTEEGLQSGLDNVVDTIKSRVSSIFSGGGGGGGAKTTDTAAPKSMDDMTFTDAFGSIDEQPFDPNAVEWIDEDFEEFNAGIDKTITKMQRMQEVSQMMGMGITNAFTQMGEGIAASLGLADGAFGAFLSTFIQGAMTFIGASLAKSMGFAIEGAAATAAASGPFAAFVLPALIAGATAAISGAFKKVPKFANGGIVSAPTMGLFGEYTGAKQNPEVVAPLDRLKSMIQPSAPQQVSVGGSFQLRGQDLVVALQRAETNRGRLK